MKKTIQLLCWLMLSGSLANAQEIQLGTPQYGGNGCPAGTASVTMSPDQQSLSILFDSYIAEAGRTTDRRVDRKSCNIAVPVRVPQGYSVALINVDYRGFNVVPSGGAYTRINADYFWAGARGPTFNKTFVGPLNDNFIFSNGLVARSVVWTPCGADLNLRVNSSIMAQANTRMDQTMIGVDSTDVSSGIVYHVQWRRCY